MDARIDVAAFTDALRERDYRRAVREAARGTGRAQYLVVYRGEYRMVEAHELAQAQHNGFEIVYTAHPTRRAN